AQASNDSRTARAARAQCSASRPSLGALGRAHRFDPRLDQQFFGLQASNLRGREATGELDVVGAQLGQLLITRRERRFELGQTALHLDASRAARVELAAEPANFAG